MNKVTRKLFLCLLILSMILTMVPTNTLAVAKTIRKPYMKKQVSMTVKKKKTLTIKGIKKSKIKKLTVKSSKKKIVKAVKKKKNKITLTAKKVGKSKITVKITYRSGKKLKKKTLKCKVTVKKRINPVPKVYDMTKTPTPTVTKAPVVTATPETPDITKKPDVTATPEATSDVTKEPDVTSTPEVTPTPDATPEVTKEPETPTPTPDATPEVTKEPETPTPTPEITPTPVPTPTPPLDYNKDGIVVTNGKLVRYEGTEVNVILPEGITSIGNEAFQKSEIESVVLPNTLKTIGIDAFNSCWNLHAIILPEGLDKIGEMAFSNSGLTSITVPGSVKDIPSDCFYGCTNLSSAILSEGIQTIGDSAFENSALQSIQFPTTLLSIGNFAFADCSSLDCELPKNLQTIGDSAFSNTGITSVVIPESVTLIEQAAFADCSKLTNVTINGTPESGGHLFDNDISIATSDGNKLAESCAHNNVHSFIVSKNGCTYDGMERTICYDCGNVENTIIKAKGHNWLNDPSRPSVSPTCTQDGIAYMVCKNCGMTDETIMPKFEHPYEHHKEDATCTTDGKEYDECQMCHEKINVTTIPAYHEYEPVYYIGDEVPTAGTNVKMKCTKCNTDLSVRNMSSSPYAGCFNIMEFGGGPNIPGQVFVSTNILDTRPNVTVGDSNYETTKEYYLNELNSLYHDNNQVWVLSDSTFTATFSNSKNAVEQALFEFASTHENGFHLFKHGSDYSEKNGLRPYIKTVNSINSSSAKVNITLGFKGLNTTVNYDNLTQQAYYHDGSSGVAFYYVRLGSSQYHDYPIYLITYVDPHTAGSDLDRVTQNYRKQLESIYNSTFRRHCFVLCNCISGSAPDPMMKAMYLFSTDHYNAVYY